METPLPSRDAPRSEPPTRYLSVDALRGFDMFWIIGGETAARALEALGGGPVVSFISSQLQHVEWEGFRFYDAIFPLFLFLVGVSIVLSVDRMVARVGRSRALARIVRRSALLFAVGVFYYGGIARPWPDVQLSGVLPRIALCYLVAATLYVLLPRKGIVIATAACLLGYWALMLFVPFPNVDIKTPAGARKQVEAKTREELFAGAASTTKGTFKEGLNLAHYVDACWLPGRKRNLYYSNEGLLSTIPAVASTLFGVLAGWVLTHGRRSGRWKVGWLVGSGLAGVVIGLLWGLEFPVIKRLWTSSFCMVAAGFSAVLLGLFYLVVDLWRWQRWCAPFLWIGGNALVVYIAVSVVNCEALAARIVGGDVARFLDASLRPGSGGFVIAMVALLLPVLFVRFLYKRNLFIRL
ncbi:acyltransferase family protein [Verrucomicrobium spinosum]|uniref:acyltransferase family protein n=1 Tax=Verrucomicrobium spinosum TaxID=2736 RepID=UPI0002FEEA66|nr:heparan-alpha-glucosaminide N-acetyltransferase domain-containing protein [Verrucomicrobium spinosum]